MGLSGTERKKFTFLPSNPYSPRLYRQDQDNVTVSLKCPASILRKVLLVGFIVENILEWPCPDCHNPDIHQDMSSIWNVWSCCLKSVAQWFIISISITKTIENIVNSPYPVEKEYSKCIRGSAIIYHFIRYALNIAMLPYRHMTAGAVGLFIPMMPDQRAMLEQWCHQVRNFSPWFEAYRILSYFSAIDLNVIVKHRSVLASLVEEP